MKAIADTNWLVAAYFNDINESRTATVERFIARYDGPWIVSLPTLLETRNIFSYCATAANSNEWRIFQSHIGTRILLPDLDWDEIQAKTEELSDRFSAKMRVGTFDLMILATALKVEATHLLSFDTNSSLRALGAVLKFKVFPELTAEDKQRVAAFR
jgi:predicted nucleic acid-binding protein